MTYLDPIPITQTRNSSLQTPGTDLVLVPDLTHQHPEIESPIEQDFVLSKREAKAASPTSIAVCGEEDPGEGLEFLVTKDTDNP